MRPTRRDPRRLVTVATALVLDRRGRYLLLRRGHQNRAYRGYWQFPEGKVEIGERPRAALAREVAEETDARVSAAAFLGTTITKGWSAGEPVTVRRLVYRTSTRGRLRLGPDHTRAAWLQPEQVVRRARLIPGARAVLRLATRSGRPTHDCSLLHRPQRGGKVHPRARGRAEARRAAHR